MRLEAEKHSFQNKLFTALIASNILLLAMDSLLWLLNGCCGQICSTIYSGFYVLYFISNPIPPFLWALYADYQVHWDEKRLRKLIYPLLAPVIVIGFMSLISLKTGLIFYLDERNIYHRGQGFPLMAAFCYTYLVYTFIMVVRNRRIIGKKIFAPLLLFPIPPLLGSILQMVYYGTNLVWTGMALSILIVYTHVQNRELNTDYLTGVNNRRGADQYVRDKIRNSNSERTFSGILLDIDNFKGINDRHGHQAGDMALKITADLLKKSLRKDDYIARYGGDEFIILLDINKFVDLKKSVDRIKDNLSDYNSSGNNAFEIRLSMGYDVYGYDSGMNVEQFIKHIDALMYSDKEIKTAKQTGGN